MHAGAPRSLRTIYALSPVAVEGALMMPSRPTASGELVGQGHGRLVESGVLLEAQRLFHRNHSFSESFDLLQHMRIHLDQGSRPFCGRSIDYDSKRVKALSKTFGNQDTQLLNSRTQEV